MVHHCNNSGVQAGRIRAVSVEPQALSGRPAASQCEGAQRPASGQIAHGGSTMTDAELRKLCHRFFDALENHDVDTISEIYHPQMKFWANISGEEKTREQ